MQYADILSLAGLRVDGRGPDEIRKMSIKVGGHLDADGSAYVEQVSLIDFHRQCLA